MSFRVLRKLYLCHRILQRTKSDSIFAGPMRSLTWQENTEADTEGTIKVGTTIAHDPAETGKTEAKSLFKPFNLVKKDYLKIGEVVSILKETSCENLCVIKVDPARTKFHYVDFFVVASGRSVRHLKSMAYSLCAKFKQRAKEDRGKSIATVEGEKSNDWMVVDIGNIVVHFMLPETRDLYELEKLWTLGPLFDDQLLKMEMQHQSVEEDVLTRFKFKFANHMTSENDFQHDK